MFALIVAAAAFGFVVLGLLALAIDWYGRREARQQHIRDRMATYCSRQP